MKDQARSYQNAVAMLRRMQRGERPTTNNATFLPQLNVPTTNPGFRGRPALHGMKQWLDKLGHQDAMDNITIAHVTGSKGKGSTCAFIESLLRTHSNNTGFPVKTGLYTSPHLWSYTERIRLNFEPVSEELFTRHAWDVIDALGIGQSDEAPRLLQALFLIAIRIFIFEEVNFAIIETHTGGRFCATNVIENPSVTAVVRIGRDHIPELGEDLETIAWHKAGIFKPGVPAFSSVQDPNVAELLRAEAKEKQTHVHFVDKNLFPHLDTKVQQENASLAIQVTNSLLLHDKRSLTQSDIHHGITACHWPGRFQIIENGSERWFLEGAHNEFCIEEPIKWFDEKSSEEKGNIVRVIIFTHISTRRDAVEILRNLLSAIQIHGVLPNYFLITNDSGDAKDDSNRLEILEGYRQMCSEQLSGIVELKSSTREAFKYAQQIGQAFDSVHILVTGSLYLVGSALGYLGEGGNEQALLGMASHAR